MIEITPAIYRNVAAELLSSLDHGQEFFNGRIEYDEEQFYSTFTCTLVIGRDQEKEITSVIPVWWEFSLCADGVEEDHDFSWREFRQYLFP